MKSLLNFLRSKKFLWTVLIVLVTTLIAIIAINFTILQKSKTFIFQNVQEAPSKQVALVLGAKVYSDGRMSDILTDRALTALDLYKAKKVTKILVSGDHGKKTYDEVNTIKDYLLQNGVPAEDLFLDHAGFDTYDSVYRAKEIFKVSSVIIVTQRFHLPRAVFIARSLDLDAVGVVADHHQYVLEKYNQLREALSRVKAFMDVTFKAQPKFLGEAIPITGSSKASWDEL